MLSKWVQREFPIADFSHGGGWGGDSDDGGNSRWWQGWWWGSSDSSDGRSNGCRRLITKSCLTLQPSGQWSARPLCSWDFGCHFLLPGIFPTQGWNPHLLHWQADSLPLSHLGNPRSSGSTHFIISSLLSQGTRIAKPHMYTIYVTFEAHCPTDIVLMIKLSQSLCQDLSNIGSKTHKNLNR